MGKAEIAIVEEAYSAGKGETENLVKEMKVEIAIMEKRTEEVRATGVSTGKIVATGCNIAFNHLLRYSEFYKVRQNKEYKKEGQTWDEFCEEHGESRRNIDNILRDLKPVYDNFQEKLSVFLNMPFSKIRYLGRKTSEKPENFSVSKDGHLLIDNQEIPLLPENKDEIEAAIDAMKDAAKAKEEDQDSKIKAKDRVLKEKERVIQKQEKELSKFERRAKEKGFEPGEEEYLKTLENIKITTQGLLLEMDTRKVPEDATVMMISTYVETLGTLTRILSAYYNDALDLAGPDTEVMMEMAKYGPGGGWVQPGLEDDMDIDIGGRKKLVNAGFSVYRLEGSKIKKFQDENWKLHIRYKTKGEASDALDKMLVDPMSIKG